MHQETIKKDSRHLLYFYSCSGGLEPTSWCLPGMPGWDISTSVWMTEPYTDAPACHWSSFHSSASITFRVKLRPVSPINRPPLSPLFSFLSDSPGPHWPACCSLNQMNMLPLERVTPAGPPTRKAPLLMASCLVSSRSLLQHHFLRGLLRQSSLKL